MKRSILLSHSSLPPLYLLPLRDRVNTDALTALNQNFDYFDLEVLQTPLCLRPACPLIKPKSRSQQQQHKHTLTHILIHTHTWKHYKYLLGTRDSGLE